MIDSKIGEIFKDAAKLTNSDKFLFPSVLVYKRIVVTLRKKQKQKKKKTLKLEKF